MRCCPQAAETDIPMRYSKTVIALFMMLLGFTQVSCASHHRSSVPPTVEPAEEMEPAAPSSLRVYSNPDAGKNGGAYGATACAVVRDRQRVAGHLKERLDRKLTQDQRFFSARRSKSGIRNARFPASG